LLGRLDYTVLIALAPSPLLQRQGVRLRISPNSSTASGPQSSKSNSRPSKDVGRTPRPISLDMEPPAPCAQSAYQLIAEVPVKGKVILPLQYASALGKAAPALSSFSALLDTWASGHDADVCFGNIICVRVESAQ